MCRFFTASDFPRECGEDRWATKDAAAVTDYLTVRSINSSSNSPACSALPFVPLGEPVTIGPNVRRFAEIPSDVFRPEQRSTCPYTNELPLTNVEIDRRHYWNLLISILPTIAAEIPNFAQTPDHAPRILELACGNLTAASALQRYFSETTDGEPTAAAEYFGIDISEHAIAAAQNAHDGVPNVHFMLADATDIGAEPWAQAPFDTVVIRHPEVFRRSENGIAATWYYIFKTAATHLRVGGLLLVTTHQCVEFQGADEALTTLGLTRLYAAQHPCAPILEAGTYMLGSGADPLRDHYVAIYTREPPPPAGLAARPAQISAVEVSARTADGLEYRVQYLASLGLLHYQSATSERSIPVPGSTGHALATDGTNTFLSFASEYSRNIVRLDLDGMDPFIPVDQIPTIGDFTYCHRFVGCDGPQEVRVLGFRMLGSQLVGDAAVIWSRDRVERTIFPLR